MNQVRSGKDFQAGEFQFIWRPHSPEYPDGLWECILEGGVKYTAREIEEGIFELKYYTGSRTQRWEAYALDDIRRKVESWERTRPKPTSAEFQPRTDCGLYEVPTRL